MIIQSNFSDLEVIRIAIAMEEEGMTFYTKGMVHTKGKLRDFLMHAAAQEMEHKQKLLKLFEELRQMQGVDSGYLFEPDVTAYIKSLAENEVFNKKKMDAENAFADLEAAVVYAIQAEETTVALYTKMYEGTKYDEVKILLGFLVEEEKEHVEYFRSILQEIQD